jgi:hypothetical protein
MAAAQEQAVRLVQVAAPEEHRQLDSLVAPVVFHPPLAAPLEVPARTEPPIISLEL